MYEHYVCIHKIENALPIIRNEIEKVPVIGVDS